MKKRMLALLGTLISVLSCGTTTLQVSQSFDDGIYCTPRVAPAVSQAEMNALVAESLDEDLVVSTSAGDTLIVPKGNSVRLDLGSDVTVVNTFQPNLWWAGSFWSPWYYSSWDYWYRPYRYYSWHYSPWYYDSWYYDPWYYSSWYYDPWYYSSWYSPWYWVTATTITTMADTIITMAIGTLPITITITTAGIISTVTTALTVLSGATSVRLSGATAAAACRLRLQSEAPAAATT